MTWSVPLRKKAVRRKRENLRFKGQSQAKDMLLVFHDMTSKSLGMSGSGGRKTLKNYSNIFIVGNVPYR